MPNTMTSFTLPSPYQTELEELNRRLKMAEMLQAQAYQPVESPGSYKGIPARISPLSGLAKALQAYTSGIAQKDLADERKALGERYRADRSADMADLVVALQGRAAEPGGMTEDASGNVTQADPRPAVAAGRIDPSALSRFRTPEMQNAALGIWQQQMARDAAPPEKIDLGDKWGFIKNNVLVSTIPKGATPDAQLKNAGENLRHATPSGSAVLGSQTTLTTHGTPSGSTLATNATTRRGQDLVNERTIDASAVAAGQRVDQDVSALRKEFNALPEVQNYRAVVPIIASAKNAPNTAAGDLDLIYAVGKSLDPNSVVREGELALVIKSGTPMERFTGLVNHVQGGGRIAPDQRKKLTNMLESRSAELKKAYEAARSTYEKDAKRRSLPVDQVFMDLGDGKVIDFKDLPPGRRP